MKALLLGTVSSVFLASAARADTLAVVTDFGPIQSITAAVMQGVGTPQVLLSGADTAHSFAMRPSHAQMLQEADIIIWTGADLSPWLAEPIETLAPSAATLALLETDGWTVLPARSAHAHGEDEDHGHDEADDHGHGEDDDHGHDEADDHGDGEADDHGHEDEAEHDAHAGAFGHDPHAWLDPAIAAVWAGHIASALETADPANAQTYRGNADAFIADMAALESELAVMLADVDMERVVLGHDTTQYFEARFDLAPAGFVAQSDAAAPGPARLQDLRSAVVAGTVTCVLGDAETNPGDIATLIEGTDARTGTIDVANTAGVGYADMMRDLVRTIAACEG